MRAKMTVSVVIELDSATFYPNEATSWEEAAALDLECLKVNSDGMNIRHLPQVRSFELLDDPADEPFDRNAIMTPSEVANPIAGGAPTQSTPDERLLQLRFFRDMTDGERLRVLTDLGAIPVDLSERLDYEMEQLLFKRLLMKGHGEALEARIDAAVSKRKGEDAV